MAAVQGVAPDDRATSYYRGPEDEPLHGDYEDDDATETSSISNVWEMDDNNVSTKLHLGYQSATPYSHLPTGIRARQRDGRRRRRWLLNRALERHVHGQLRYGERLGAQRRGHQLPLRPSGGREIDERQP